MGEKSYAPAAERLDKGTTQPPVGRGARVVPLGQVAQVIKGTYFNPLHESDTTPLPRHYWELHNAREDASDSLVVIRSTASNKDGISQILDGKKLKHADPEQKWFLVLRPEITNDQLDAITSPGLRELWIDLEKNTWVVKPSFPEFDKRKLLRIPIWTSAWKARSAGFKDIPSNEFGEKGLLTTEVVRASFGTATRPWEIQIDFGWMRTYLQFHYYDVIKGTSRPVPPGLCVKALGQKLDVATLTRAPGRVGGGTAIDDKGTIYVLHERDPFSSSDVELSFENTSGKALFIDLRQKSEKDALERKSPAPTDPRDRYLLPDAWHSYGMEGRVGAAGKRQRWADMRPTPLHANPVVSLITSAESPLVFHLDDLTLHDHEAGSKSLPKGARVTIFDHRLDARGPLDKLTPPLFHAPLEGHYLRAEEVYCSASNTYPMTAFVINHEGNFYVLREARVDGKLGATPCIGARKAVSRAPENPIGDFLDGFPALDKSGHVELHLLPDAYPGPFNEWKEGVFFEKNPSARFCHLLVYVPLEVIPDPKDPKMTAARLNKVHEALLHAAERWTQAHPAFGAVGAKDYVVIPETGVKEGTRVVKLRYFFGTRTDGGHKMTIKGCTTNELGRSFVRDGEMSLLVSGADETPAKGSGEDSDKLSMAWFSLAHELGHVMGLPDEYAEHTDVEALKLANPNNPSSIVRFGQAHEAYPFRFDFSAMMRGTQLPRLRYPWHFIHFLNQDPGAKAQLPEGPYLLSYPSFQGGTAHKMPDGNNRPPWDVVATQKTDGGKATLVLFRLGDDEGSVEAMFQRPAGTPATPGSFLDGVLVVRTKLWFNFLASSAGDFKGHDERWKVIRDFHQQFFAAGTRAQRHRFFLEGPKSARLQRIAILLEPRIEYGPSPSPKLGFEPPNVTESDADIVVNVVFQLNKPAPPAKPIPPDTTSLTGPTRLSLNQPDVGLCILRFALGQSVDPAQPPNNTPLGAPELESLARAVESMLGAPSKSFTIKPLP